MKKLFKFTEHPVIATLISSAILGIGYGTITAKLGEWWNYFVTSVKAMYNFILFLLNYEIRVWVFIVFIAVVIGGLFLYAWWWERRNNTVGQEVENNGVVLSALEMQILRLFEQHYGQAFNIENIGRRLNNSDMLSVEDAVLGLAHDYNFLKRHDNIVTGTSFTLSGYGRNYILQNMR